MPDNSSSVKLPATITYDSGLQDYTAAGQADADLTSALMALDSLLKRNDLSQAQRRDFGAAQRWATRAAQAMTRHLDYNFDAQSK